MREMSKEGTSRVNDTFEVFNGSTSSRLKVQKSGKSKRKLFTLMVATIAPAHVCAFSSSALSPIPLRQPLHFQIPSPTRLPMTLTDPETLLRETTSFKTVGKQRQSKRNSTGIKKQVFNAVGSKGSVSLKDDRTQDELRNRIKKASRVAKSSTMPGFIERKHSGRHRKFREGLKIAQDANEGDVAKKIKETVTSQKETKKRRKDNSVDMYTTSASVPDSLIAFTNELHMESLITPKEEKELGTKTQEAIRVQEIYETLSNKLSRDPTDEEWCVAAGKINIEALQEVIGEGLEAKNKLVTSNLRMVQGVVNVYLRNGLGSQYNAGDLMQEGTLALIRAAEKFKPELGWRFSTYAMYWIRSSVKRSQVLQSRIIQIPQRHHERHKKILSTEIALKKELGRKPSSSELAVAVGLTQKQLDTCLKSFSQECFSLDAEIHNTLKPNSGTKNMDTMYALLHSKTDDSEYDQLQRTFLRDDLIKSIKRYLSPSEVDLLLLRYGLMDERTLPYGFSGPLTIAEVSKLVDLKPNKVRRIISKCLRELKYMIAHEWEDYEKSM